LYDALSLDSLNIYQGEVRTEGFEVPPTSAVPIVIHTPIEPSPSYVHQPAFTPTIATSRIQPISGTQNGIPADIHNGVLYFHPAVQYAAPNQGISGIEGISPTYAAVPKYEAVSINEIPVGTSYEAVSVALSQGSSSNSVSRK
jgi:hypothetical protein